MVREHIPAAGFRLLLSLALAAALLQSASADEELLRQLINAEDTSRAPQKSVEDRGNPQQDEFIPLLAPVRRRRRAASHSENVFHGRLRIREIYQRLNNGTYDASSRLQSNGGIERLQGSTLSLTWNAELAYRTGTSFTSATDHKHPRLHLFDLALAGRGEDGGVRRFGRFIPLELPGLGYLDGLQLERHASEKIHLGAMAGARPDRKELDPSGKELIGAGYGSYETGVPGEHYYAGTVGLLQSSFRGVRDELALLYDQRSDLGPRLNLYLSSQFDFNSGVARVHTEDVRLTRLNLALSSPLASFLRMRAGADHFERPDTAAERDFSGSTNLAAIDSGYWRYWLGSHQGLPLNFQLDEEIAVIRAPSQPDQGQARGTISHLGFLFAPQALLGLTAYTLNRVDGYGLGTTFSAIFPVAENRVNVTANAGTRYSGRQGERKKWNANDASLYIVWFVSRAWEVDLGVVQTYQDYVQSSLADFSLNYRW
jgi:hypothetical protein